MAGSLKLGAGAGAECEHEPQLMNHERRGRKQRDRPKSGHPGAASHSASRRVGADVLIKGSLRIVLTRVHKGDLPGPS